MPQLRTLRKKKVRSRGLFQTACQVKNVTLSKVILSLFTTKRVIAEGRIEDQSKWLTKPNTKLTTFVVDLTTCVLP